jgi:hypothetical protein
MIIRVWRRLLAAAKELREHGTVPPGVDQPELYRQRSGWALVPTDADFWEYLRPQREAFQHVETVHTNGTAQVTGNGTVSVDQHIDDAAIAPERVKQPA